RDRASGGGGRPARRPSGRGDRPPALRAGAEVARGGDRRSRGGRILDRAYGGRVDRDVSGKSGASSDGTWGRMSRAVVDRAGIPQGSEEGSRELRRVRSGPMEP